MEYYVRIDGGIGRCIAATGAVVKFAKDKKVNVVTSFPFCFEGLENIERVYPIGTPFLYEDKISQGIYLEPEPYNHYAYYAEHKHLSQVFNILLNNCDEFIAPIIRLTENEKNNGKQMICKEKKGKKVVLVQPFSSNGGKPILATKSVAIDESYRSLGYEFLKKLCDRLNDEGYSPIIVKSPEQAGYENSREVKTNPRGIFSLIPSVDGIICCDSFLHHASAGLGTPVKTIVLWAGTDKRNLSYPEQINICSVSDSLVEPNRIPHDHAYYVTKNKGINENFNVEDVIKALKNKK